MYCTNQSKNNKFSQVIKLAFIIYSSTHHMILKIFM
jgi:hypothetical protein